MKATFTLESFPVVRGAVHLLSAGQSSLLQGDAIKAHLRRTPEGRLLRVVQISNADDLHSEFWEMHPAGDEVLIMLTGSLGLEYSDGSRHSASLLERSHGVVMPQGAWHRLVFREPGMLLALSPLQGTQLSHKPGGRP